MPIIPNTELMKKRRKELGLTQKDLCHRMQQLGYRMNDNHYSRIERGVPKYTNVQLETAFAIARCLESSVEDLFSVEFREEVEEFSPAPSEKKKMVSSARPKLKEAIGGALKEARVKSKYTLQEIADAMEWHPSYVYIVENGKASDEVMKRYAEFLGVDLSLLRI